MSISEVCCKVFVDESYGEGVGSGVLENEKDSNLGMRPRILMPNHDRTHDAHHVADQPDP